MALPTEFQLPQINMLIVAPLVFLAAAGLLMVLLDAFVPSIKRGGFALFSILAIALTGTWLAILPKVLDVSLGTSSLMAFDNMLIFDRMAVLSILIIFDTAILTILLSHDYLRTVNVADREYFSLIIFATLSMALMCASNDLITLFIALEMLSLCLYVLVGINRRSAESQEGALKYFILGSVASAFMLLGIAYLWGATGTTNLSQMRLELVALSAPSAHRWMFIAMALIIIGFAFKIALVPFHQWVPEAYAGAPTPITAFLATGSKAAGFIAFFHVLQGVSSWEYAADFAKPMLTALVVVTVVAGNVLAVVQSDIKRMLAYSSVAHSGYMLVGVLVYAVNIRTNPALADMALNAVLFYLFAYTALNMIAFGVASALAPKGDGQISNLGGLMQKNGVLAGAMSVAMFGLTGIPFTVGFSGKFYVFGAAVESGFIALAVTAFLASVISAFYYLRVVVVMTMQPAPEGEGATDGAKLGVNFSWASLFVIVVCTAASFVFFFFPESFLGLFV